ncbi:inactive dipeptidyl peptidase 10-like [Megalops cyprinoides]|uniref:inactive dipeptidyl peptidase 10-like n=1 Tax=Megalops cyprinoides TaxID=118141 RepID=UPI0018643600|nr:inactive dipeptidyl peptidase 10-like [Megalops cyprinoides]
MCLTNKDLVDTGPERNWKGIGISLLVIVVVLSLIGLAIVLLSKDDSSKSLGSRLTLDDLFERDFLVHDPEAQWVNDEEIVFRTKDGDVLRANVRNNQTEVLLKNTTFSTFQASTFAVSPDFNFVLLGYNLTQVFRYSFLASYMIYNLHTREVQELNPPEVTNSLLQYTSWGIRDQQLVYIFENNIYYQPDVKASSLRLTSSGQEGAIFNGIADWLYEEEVLHSHVAHWWAPNGERLAFLSINDTLVPNMILPRLTGTLYPRGHQYPYPKVGQINPTVKLYVVNLDGASQTTELRPPSSFEKSQYYIVMVKWVTSLAVAVRWLNRAQNTSILTLCDATSGDCVKKHVMTSDTWLDRQDEEPVFSKDGRKFFLTMPIKHGGQGAFRHLAMLSEQTEQEDVNIRHLTSGNWEVTQISAYDEATNTVYFLSTEEGSTRRHLYRVSTADPFHHECLTCNLFRHKCTFYTVDISPSAQHVLLNCKGPSIPKTTVHRLSDLSSNLTLESNRELREALKYRRVPRREKRTLHVNGFAFPMEVTFPVDFDETNQYPLLLIIDSTPGGQSVKDHFMLDWDSVLVSSDLVIVARVDGRGAKCQGQRVLQAIHQRLGTVDVQDQIAAVESLAKLSYVDESRIGVYGKVYGGFLASLLLLSPGTLFRCGVAVAPVTDWRLYGSVFSERYFGFPAQEFRKYNISSLLPNITGASHSKFLIIHGTADATVHFQHTAELVKFLSKANVNYTLQIFPDEGHELASVRSRHYLFSSMTTFFRECFQGDFPVTQEPKEED